MTTFSPGIDVPEIPPIEFPWENPQPNPPQEPVKVLPIIVHGATYVWDDVYKFATGLFDNLLGVGQSVASVTFQDVSNIVKVAMSAEQTVWVNFVVQLEQWVNDAAAHLQTAIVGVGQWALTEFLRVYQELIDLSATMVQLLQEQIAMVENDIIQVEHNLTNIIEMTTLNLENWVRTDIALPIMRAIQDLDLKTQMEMQSILVQAETYADDLMASRLAPLLLTIAAMQGQIRQLLTESDECTQPMCDTMGPKTDLGKWLKRLGELLGLLAGFEIAQLTEQDFERIARMLTTGIATPAEDLLTGFVTQGETVGGAASEVVGDIGHVGLDLLRELGIPV